METIIKDIIQDIKEKTDIDITVFDMLGEKIAATKEGLHGYVDVSSQDFANKIYVDPSSKVCCFLFSSPYNMFMGVINGADGTAKNYAFMISSMIENALMQREENPDKIQSLNKILSGQASDLNIKRLVKKFPTLNLPCFVLAIKCDEENIEDVLQYLQQLAGDTKDTALLTADDAIAYIHNIETENVYQSAADFAQMLYDNIEQELSAKVKIGVGNYAKDAFELASAFSQGSSAIKMGMASNGKNNIYSYKEFIMMRMIEEIPQATLKNYLEILLDSGAKEILSDPDMLSTAEEFLANNLNISETSRNLYMHRNTLMYRLDKIEKITGLNIRRFSDAVTFRIILILYKHLNY